MSDRGKRLDKLEKLKAPVKPFKFTMGRSLARGERPSPGRSTLSLEDPSRNFGAAKVQP